MSSKVMDKQVEAAVQPLLTQGEEVRRSAPAWAVEQRGRAPLLFRARHLYEVVLTDQRLILFTRPRRRRPLGVNNLVIAKRYSTFSLEKTRRLRPMLQLRVRAPGDRVLVLEFRPRNRRVGRELADHLDQTSNGEAVPPKPRSPDPVQPQPAPFAPPPAAPPAAAPAVRETAPARVPSDSFPVPIQPQDASRRETEWQGDQWYEEARESERRTRKEKRAAKKQAKQAAKEARAEQNRKEGNLSRRERSRDEKAAKKAVKKAKTTASEHDEMLQYLQK